MDIQSGYLIVKTFEKLYKDYVDRYKLSSDLYAIPRIDRLPEQYTIKYRGLDRDALDDYNESEIFAELMLDELVKNEKCIDGFLFDYKDVLEVYQELEAKSDYEIIWTKIAASEVKSPEGFISIGYEATYFTGDHFSASCDCMLIPRWHGTDDEGELFLKYFNKLNKFGLFDSPAEAEEFLKYYLSFDWTETGEYEIVEVFIRDPEAYASP